MRPPGRGDCWILKIAHALSPKNLSKIGFCLQKGVAFLWKELLQKKFSGAGERLRSAAVTRFWPEGFKSKRPLDLTFSARH